MTISITCDNKVHYWLKMSFNSVYKFVSSVVPQRNAFRDSVSLGHVIVLSVFSLQQKPVLQVSKLIISTHDVALTSSINNS